MANDEIVSLFSLPDNSSLREGVKEISRGCKKLFVSSDPKGHQLGSGGGTAWILAEAWRPTACIASMTFPGMIKSAGEAINDE